MANNTKIKQRAKARVFEIMCAIEEEIAAGKRTGRDIIQLENLLSCFLCLQEQDLARFRLSEWALTGGILLARRCQMKSLEMDCAGQYQSSIVEMPYGRPVVTTYGEARQIVEAHLTAGRRVLLICTNQESLDRVLQSTVASLTPQPTEQTPAVVTIAPEGGGNQNTTIDQTMKTNLDVMVATLAADGEAARSRLQTERAALTKACDDILVILTARSALTQEIAMLNLIHLRCDELSGLNKALSDHIRELERSIASLQAGAAKPPTAWKALWNHLTGITDKDGDTMRLRQKELSSTKKRLKDSEREADHLTLEMCSRQAFITETTNHVLRRLAQFAPSFAEAVNLIGSHRQRIKEIDKTLKAWPKDVVAEDVLASACLSGVTVDGLFNPQLRSARFDVVVIDNAQLLPLAITYWAVSHAVSCLGFVISAGDAGEPLGDTQPCKYWFGRTIVDQLSAGKACTIKSGWSPAMTLPATVTDPGPPML